MKDERDFKDKFCKIRVVCCHMKMLIRQQMVGNFILSLLEVTPLMSIHTS